MTLNESIVLEIRLANNTFFTSIYRSPSQNKDQYDEFCSRFYMLMSNINDEKALAFTIIGHFNARSKKWWSQDITNSQGSITDTLTSTSAYYQLINLPTYILFFSIIHFILIWLYSSSNVYKHIRLNK